MLPEQLIELRNRRVIVGNGLGLELAQSPVDLCGSQFHCLLLRVGLARQGHAPPRATGASHVEVVKRHRSSAHPAETHVGCPAVWSTENSKRQRNAADSITRPAA